jgi:hypothetical protein
MRTIIFAWTVAKIIFGSDVYKVTILHAAVAS